MLLSPRSGIHVIIAFWCKVITAIQLNEMKLPSIIRNMIKTWSYGTIKLAFKDSVIQNLVQVEITKRVPFVDLYGKIHLNLFRTDDTASPKMFADESSILRILPFFHLKSVGITFWVRCQPVWKVLDYTFNLFGWDCPELSSSLQFEGGMYPFTAVLFSLISNSSSRDWRDPFTSLKHFHNLLIYLFPKKCTITIILWHIIPKVSPIEHIGCHTEFRHCYKH